MKKKLLFILTLLAITLFAMAEMNVYLYKKDGTKVLCPAIELDSIGFVDIDSKGYEYVDLGLPSGTLWATCNLGAETPTEHGRSFAWGDIIPNRGGSTSSYIWYKNSKYTKYNTTDQKQVLDLEDDAANVYMGGNWRLPTKTDFDELLSNCTTELLGDNGWGGKVGSIHSIRFTSKKNSKSIIFSAKIYTSGAGTSAGYYIWLQNSSSLDQAYVAYLSVYYMGDGWYSLGTINTDTKYRYNLYQIRPVLSRSNSYRISFSANGGEGSTMIIDAEHGENITIPTNTFTRDGYEFVGWLDESGNTYLEGETITLIKEKILYAQWYKKEPDGVDSEYEYVDLGLPSGTKWATCNVGATSPEENGSTFSAYDAVPWGGDWRKPTDIEISELVNYCTVEAVKFNGVECYKITSKINGNSILIRSGFYWSSKCAQESCTSCRTCYIYGLRVENKKISTSTASSYVSDGNCNYTQLYIRPVRKDNYTITFDANGGEGTIQDINAYYATEIEIPTCSFTRDGYEFIGWNTSADGKGIICNRTITLHSNMTLYAQWRPNVPSGTENGYEWVSLGLPSGTRWASCNIGATTPDGYGDYFAWGETTPKDTYSTSNYKWYINGNSSNISKYNFAYSTGMIKDSIDILELEDDAAYVNWGGPWRMPTKEEIDELRTKCTWKWGKNNGIEGYTVTGPNGNSIFLPAKGSYGRYWSSFLSASSSDYAYYLYIYSDNISTSTTYRYNGYTVRPVLPADVENIDSANANTITFNANGGEGNMAILKVKEGESITLPANILNHKYADFIGWNTQADGSGIEYSDNARITPTLDVTLYAQWTEVSTTGVKNSHEWVDLGLPSGIKWATTNVGATTPNGYGNYYAWGETTTKSTYSWSNYKWCNGSSDTMTKYCVDSNYGTVDNKNTLELEDDAANANWGGDWRTPTKPEIDELRTQCTWTWTTQNDVNGYIVTGPNGNSIFLPTGGYYNDSGLQSAGSNGNFWSSSLNISNSNNSHRLRLVSESVSMGNNFRYIGRSVRPVLRDIIKYEVVFDSNGGEGAMQSIAVENIEKLNIPRSIFTREGYGFIYWNTAPDGTGTSYAVGDKVLLTSDITLYAQWGEPNDTGTADGHEWVDLGLPSCTKWATTNVGATTPEAYGDYFAWGETEPKSNYDLSTYKWCNGSSDTMTKYCASSSHGIVDNKTTLELEDDAANVHWGDKWRMPTEEEIEELRTKCTWEWTTLNEVNGYKVTGPIGNSIFIPTGGYYNNSSLTNAGSNGNYWSSSLNVSNSNNSYRLRLESNEVSLGNNVRYCGRSVRPVLRE